MTEPIRVWAPSAKRLEVLVGGSRIDATPEPGGWWRGPVVASGTDYQLSLDGGPPRPDPRSRWQPLGPHGPSRAIDLVPPAHGARVAPLADAVLYELHVGTFTNDGTFAALVEHLDHLVELGVTHVQLMPIAQFPGRFGWGYDGVDFYAPHAAYGRPDELRALIEELHTRNLAVLIDVVHNHFGPEGAYVDDFGPYRTDRHRTPWGAAINLDGPGSREVRRFLIESGKQWMRDYGADGLRLDALHILRDDSERHFAAELVDEVHNLERELGRPLLLIGEYDEHDPIAITESSAGGWGLDAHWNDDFHHAVHALLTREAQGYYVDFAAPGTLAKVLERGYALDGVYSPFRGARHGSPYGDRSRGRLVAYVQSHDQIGNRPRGERLHVLCGHARARIAAALLFVSPFVPMIFQGEEWAASTPFYYFADLGSPELRAAVREGRRTEHGGTWHDTPDPLDPATRDASVLRWSERHDGEHARMLAWYTELASARHTYPELRDGSPRATRARELADGRGLVVERGRLALYCNFSIEPLAVETTDDVLLASEPLATHRELPPESCALVRC